MALSWSEVRELLDVAGVGSVDELIAELEQVRLGYATTSA